jgi:intermediate cleaving peptidase 55
MIAKCDERFNVSLNQLQDETYALIKEECSKLFGRQMSHSDMNVLYPHHVGHWLGLDLHDTSSVSRFQPLVKGMVITIEPGLYVPDSPNFPEEFRGIGVRIEDDIAIGNEATGGPINLTAEAPKEIDDIEAIMSGIIQAK